MGDKIRIEICRGQTRWNKNWTKKYDDCISNTFNNVRPDLTSKIKVSSTPASRHKFSSLSHLLETRRKILFKVPNNFA